jgi:hypothetical protein
MGPNDRIASSCTVAGTAGRSFDGYLRFYAWRFS